MSVTLFPFVDFFAVLLLLLPTCLQIHNLPVSFLPLESIVTYAWNVLTGHGSYGWHTREFTTPLDIIRWHAIVFLGFYSSNHSFAANRESALSHASGRSLATSRDRGSIWRLTNSNIQERLEQSKLPRLQRTKSRIHWLKMKALKAPGFLRKT